MLNVAATFVGSALSLIPSPQRLRMRFVFKFIEYSVIEE